MEKKIVLIYRRTHKGDPGWETEGEHKDKHGVFGCNGCMGQVRGWGYDAVIGIGGLTAAPKDMSKKINWIGCKRKNRDNQPIDEKGHPLVTFEHFKSWDAEGGEYPDVPEKLYKHMFVKGKIPRTGKNFSPEIDKEIEDLLKLAENEGGESLGNPKKILGKANKKNSCKKSQSPKRHSGGCL